MPERLNKNTVYFQKGETWKPEYGVLGWCTAQYERYAFRTNEHLSYETQRKEYPSMGLDYNFFLRTRPFCIVNGRFERSCSVLAFPDDIDAALEGDKNEWGYICP